MNNDNLPDGLPDWGEPNANAPIWPNEQPTIPIPAAWPETNQPQPQPQPEAFVPHQTEADVIRELINVVGLLGRDAVQTRSVLEQQSEILRGLQSQMYQSSQDSVELTRRVADHAANTFRTLATASSSGTAVAVPPGPARPATVKVREPRMFIRKILPCE
ncbi:hypothetical protein BV20DRAFT_1050692 [Pilatotrama ljubarskyi]|nr:hypothetical protein BV20DRAFT_1050692 [Pilatotrama ljubarskyi]